MTRRTQRFLRLELELLDHVKDVLVVPIEALDRADTSPRVFVVDHDRRVESREVKIGLEAGDRAEIASGLTVDDMVVVGNRSQLKAGTVVSPKVMTRVPVAEGAR